jgi:hypothetical protein
MRKILCCLTLSVATAMIPTAAMASTAGEAGARVVAGAARSPLHRARTDRPDVISTDWAGWLAFDTSPFSGIGASWTEPTADCTMSSAEYAQFWVGLDGYSDPTHEEIGSDSDCHGKNKPSYYAWYEMSPAGLVKLSRSKYPVEPGDTLTGEVSVSGLDYTFTLDSSRGWSFSTTISGSSSIEDSSAEWIAESPDICNSSGTHCSDLLADFGTVTFTGAEAAAGGGSFAPITSFTAKHGPHRVTCETSSGTVRIASSPIGSGGESFTLTWEHD